MDFLRNNPIASLIVVTVVVVAGAVVTITNPDTLAFSDYVKDVAVATGLLAVGRGIENHGK